MVLVGIGDGKCKAEDGAEGDGEGAKARGQPKGVAPKRGEPKAKKEKAAKLTAATNKEKKNKAQPKGSESAAPYQGEEGKEGKVVEPSGTHDQNQKAYAKFQELDCLPTPHLVRKSLHNWTVSAAVVCSTIR